MRKPQESENVDTSMIGQMVGAMVSIAVGIHVMEEIDKMFYPDKFKNFKYNCKM